MRIALGEAGHLGHLLRNFSLRLHAEEIFQRRSALQPRNGQRRRPQLRRLGVLRSAILWGRGLRRSHTRRHGQRQYHRQRRP